MILIQKALLILISLVLMFYSNIDISIICITTLCIITMSYLEYYLNFKNNKIYYLLISIILILINHNFIFFLPIIIYDTIDKRTFYLSPIILFLLLLIFNISDLNKVLLILFSISSAFISLLTQYDIRLKNQVLKLEDNYFELENNIAIKNKELIISQDNEIYMATLKERGRIARDIHDNVGHILSSSIIQLGAIKKINKDDNLSLLLDQLNNSLNEGMQSIRTSVHQIHSQSSDLKKEIDFLIDNYMFCKIHLNYDISDLAPNKVKTTFLAIIKEALNNCSKHSNATIIKINIRELEKHYQLIISDNGNKINLNSTGIGLENMKTRVETLNGIINITNDNGFKIHISIIKES
ncbi:signal transduction histidine kinase [Bacilli bacterium PM5-9]|nr:signal transduction histidine kinase [Bacilli bacterium PM5-9]